jgi:hypothetical protein
MNYVRSSIDLAIKEKFGFHRIPKMIVFIDRLNLGSPFPLMISSIRTFHKEAEGYMRAVIIRLSKLK